MISFTDPGSNWFITSCSLQGKSDPRPSTTQPTFGKWTKLSQRTKLGRFTVFRFRCWLKEHEAHRLPGYAGVQICESQGAQGGWTFDKKNECPVLSSYYKELKEGRNQQHKITKETQVIKTQGELTMVGQTTAVKEASEIWRHFSEMGEKCITK